MIHALTASQDSIHAGWTSTHMVSALFHVFLSADETMLYPLLLMPRIFEKLSRQHRHPQGARRN